MADQRRSAAWLKRSARLKRYFYSQHRAARDSGARNAVRQRVGGLNMPAFAGIASYPASEALNMYHNIELAAFHRNPDGSRAFVGYGGGKCWIIKKAYIKSTNIPRSSHGYYVRPQDGS